MFCGKMSHNLIVKTHYKTLRAIYDTQSRSSEELLHLNGKKKTYTKNLQILMVEVYKCLNNINPPFTWDNFKQKNNPYNLRNTQLLELSKCWVNVTLFKEALLWNKPLNHFKEEKSLIHFKNKIGGIDRKVLVVSAIKLPTCKKCAYAKKKFKSAIKYLYF